MGALPPKGVRGRLDRHACLEHRRLDVLGRLRLADDESEPVAADGLSRAGRGQPADVRVPNP